VFDFQRLIGRRFREKPGANAGEAHKHLIARLVSKLIARAGLYRRIWHPALFDFALYICLVASLVFASKEVFS